MADFALSVATKHIFELLSRHGCNNGGSFKAGQGWRAVTLLVIEPDSSATRLILAENEQQHRHIVHIIDGPIVVEGHSNVTDDTFTANALAMLPADVAIVGDPATLGTTKQVYT